MAADGQHETVAAALVTALQEIDSTPIPSDPPGGPDEASLYHHKPTAIFRVRWYERGYWADEFASFIMVRSGPATWTRDMNCEWQIDREFYIMAAAREDDAERIPWQAAPGDSRPLPPVIQNRLVDDVTLALLSDEQLGGVADGIAINSVEYGYAVEGWTNVELTITVSYHVPVTGA